MVTAAIVLAPIIAGMIGNAASSGDRQKSQQAAMQAYQEAMSLGYPPDLTRELILKQFKSAGTYTPELESDIDVGISEVSQIQEDPALRQQQSSALQLLAQRGRGLGVEERAAVNQIRDEMARDSEAKRQQIVQSYQQRGMGGAGAELAAQLQQAQASANQASLEGDRISATSAANALDAISKSGTLSGQVRGQDFDVANAKASAADEFKRFDTQNQIARQQRNVASTNDAAQSNLANQQALLNANTEQANAEKQRQNEAQRTYWNDQLTRTQLRSNAALGQASNLNNQAQQTATQWQGIGSGVGAGLSSYQSYKAKQDQTAADAEAKKKAGL